MASSLPVAQVASSGQVPLLPEAELTDGVGEAFAPLAFRLQL